ncbi:MAG TPA: hydroxyacid dehydrogenase [Segeticoccus sp.]|nr:hydroxyacid dehydrogenase [Segeticoccus sp.]
MSTKLELAFAMRPGLCHQLFSPDGLQLLAGVADFDADQVWHDFASPRDLRDLATVQVLVTGWGSPRLTQDVVQAMPHLTAVVHAGGSVKGHLPPEFWTLGILVSTAADANAVPVAEYTVAAILFANKRVPFAAADYRSNPRPIDWVAEEPAPNSVGSVGAGSVGMGSVGMGNVGKRVGVVGASRIGRRVLELLRPFSLETVVHDPYLTDGRTHADAPAPVDAPVLPLDELLATSDVVTLHAPDLPETRHLVDRRRLALMRDGATLINTARGALVDHDALVEELTRGRLSAVLDVTEPDVLPGDSPLLHLPNVLVTPHIAGSLGNDLTRLGDAAVAEIRRLAAGAPLAHAVAPDQLHRSA